MLSATDIRDIKFSKAVGGYRQDEVDVLLDKVEADYEQNERTIRAMQDEIQRLNREIEGYKSSQDSIQQVLLNAQKLADQMIAEAKLKSESIIHEAQENVDRIASHEKELSQAFEEKASLRKASVEKELEEAIREAQNKKASIDNATADSIARQQLLFDKLKLEVYAFKADITRKYKEHLEILQKLPDEVPMDPKRIAEAVAAIVEREPVAEDFIVKPETVAPQNEEAPKAENGGFVVDTDESLTEE